MAMVGLRSGTVTQNRRVISSRRYRHRQRTTLLALGSGPASTRSHNSLICAALDLGAAPGGSRDARPSTPCSL
jgi:hypothetical protein